MTGWFRMYGEVINDPKVMRLAEAMRWHWVAVLCTASMNDGRIPVLRDLAFLLRMREQQAAAILTELHAGGLLDKVDGGFVPHNWSGRQYKTDVTDPTAPQRMKRYRERKRNERNATVTEIRPEAEQSRTDTEQSRAEAPRAVVSSSEKALRSDLMEVFPNAPNYDRTAVWLGKGYAPSMIVGVAKELLARKPDIANLAYFDAALAERHSKRAETPSERAAAAPAVDLDKVVSMYALTGVWSRYAGPEPGLSGCKVPADLLAKHGLDALGQKIRAAV